MSNLSRFRPAWIALGLLAVLALLVGSLRLIPQAGARQGSAASERVIVDATGREVRVPAEPQRIVALSEPDLDALLALGVQPVGTVQGRGQSGPPRYLGDRAQGIPLVGTVNGPNIEAVLALNPDLILAGSLADEQVLAQLRLIAPTVVTGQLGEPWQEPFTRVAQAVQREAEAEAFMTTYERRLEEVRAALGPAASAQVSIVRWNAQGPVYMLPGAFSSRVVAELGLQRPEHQASASGAGHSPTLSLEMLELIDADWIFLGTLAPEGEAVQAMEAVMETPAFQQLDAVRNGRFTLVDGSLWSSASGPLAALAILDDVEEALSGR